MPCPSAVLDFLLLEAWSPLEVHGNSVLASAQEGSRARWETGLETAMEAWADCAVSFYTRLYPLMSHFFCYRQKSAKGRVRESWCSKWSSCWFRQSSHTSGEPPPLAFCSTVLSPFLNSSQLPAGSTLYSAVMSSTQSRCSSVCVCVFFKLANLAVFL